MNGKDLIVVDSGVLPEVFLKVLEAKKIIANKEEKSCAAACKKAGISRSAYYKYKDFVFNHEELITEKIVNLYIVLKDKPGVLSSVLVFLHNLKANILTVNQNIPVDGVAAVSISLKFTGDSKNELSTLNSIGKLDGVVEIRMLSAS